MTTQDSSIVNYQQDSNNSTCVETDEDNLVKKNTFAELKTTEIYRVVYPLSFNESKQVIVSMDPTNDFEAIITLGSPGWSGYRLSLNAFKVLLKNINYINAYFINPTDNYTTLHLSGTDVVGFCKNSGETFIFFCKKFDIRDRLCLGKSSWDRLVDLGPLVSHIADIYESWKVNVMDVFDCILTALEMSLLCSRDNIFKVLMDPETVIETLKSLKWGDIEYVGRGNMSLDSEKCFLELRTFCVEHISSLICKEACRYLAQEFNII
jgi:hypothetical protein